MGLLGLACAPLISSVWVPSSGHSLQPDCPHCPSGLSQWTFNRGLGCMECVSWNCGQVCSLSKATCGHSVQVSERFIHLPTSGAFQSVSAHRVLGVSGTDKGTPALTQGKLNGEISGRESWLRIGASSSSQDLGMENKAGIPPFSLEVAQWECQLPAAK